MSASPMLASRLTGASIWGVTLMRWLHAHLSEQYGAGGAIPCSVYLFELQNRATRVMTERCLARRMLSALPAATWVQSSACGS